MNRIITIQLFVIAVMLMSACNKEQDMVQHTSSEITFNITPKTGISTRSNAGRDPNTSQALQWVTDMRIYAFKKQTDDSNTYIYTQVTVDGAGTKQDYYSVPWSKGTKSKTYKITPRLEVGDTYVFLAVGLDDGKINFKDLNFTGKTLEEAALCLKDNLDCREVFVGKTDAMEIKANMGFNISLELNRIVAGVLGYFKNIPATYNGKEVKSIKVRLYTNKNTQQCLVLPNSTKIEDGAVSNNTILDISLLGVGNKQTVVIGGKAVNVNVTIVNNIYQYQYYDWPADLAGIDIRVLNNTVLQSAFVMPVMAPAAKEYTIRVELCDAAGKALKFWNVYIDKMQDGDLDTNLLRYSILPNHYYSLGKKTSNGTSTDEPMDLSKDQEFVITVNPEWEDIHDMGITDPVNPPENDANLGGDINLDDDNWDGIN